MKGKTIRQPGTLRAVLGAALTIFCGLLLWFTPLGEAWVNISYDYLFRCGSRPITNKVTLILLDNESYDEFHQTRGEPWNRALHAKLLNKLADDGSALVVFDSFFRSPRDTGDDSALAEAMRRQRVVLMAGHAEVTHSELTGAHPVLPADLFLEAAQTNWGVAWLDPDLDLIVRRHWPFPSPGPYPALPWTVARLTGAPLPEEPRERWLRYYGPHGAWMQMSYKFALSQPTNYFHDQIVFIGNRPATTLPGDELDEFQTPYTRWTGESAGGVEIIVASYLNLVNGEWLERPSLWMELGMLAIAGILLGGGIWRLRLAWAGAVALIVAVAVAIGAIYFSYTTNYWFPWLVIAGGQVPCALAWAVAVKVRQKKVGESPPVVPGYKIFRPPFGKGAYGKVWLARNKAGQWQALKVVYRASFESADPYEREYRGVTKYQPISDKHPGLLRVELLSDKWDDGFYYLMELGDSLAPDWKQKPKTYRPRDLFTERMRQNGKRLPVPECVRIGLALIDAMEFLHQHGLTHRDIKPQNIIFVNGQPKLADLGLIAEVRQADEEQSFVGTVGYMPPPPEMPGTPQADLYALGMVLYVLSTGRNVGLFPEIATSLVEGKMPENFFPLNTVILKACQADPARRYANAAEMRTALLAAQNQLAGN